MEQLTNSRLITWPSVVEKLNNYTVILVDATAQEIEDLADFFRTCDTNFDVYLYEGNGDLEYLHHISSRADAVLINETSQVYATTSQTHYGPAHLNKNPLEYFTKMDNTLLTSN